MSNNQNKRDAVNKRRKTGSKSAAASSGLPIPPTGAPAFPGMLPFGGTTFQPNGLLNWPSVQQGLSMESFGPQTGAATWPMQPIGFNNVPPILPALQMPALGRPSGDPFSTQDTQPLNFLNLPQFGGSTVHPNLPFLSQYEGAVPNYSSLAALFGNPTGSQFEASLQQNNNPAVPQVVSLMPITEASTTPATEASRLSSTGRLTGLPTEPSSNVSLVPPTWWSPASPIAEFGPLLTGAPALPQCETLAPQISSSTVPQSGSLAPTSGVLATPALEPSVQSPGGPTDSQRDQATDIPVTSTNAPNMQPTNIFPFLQPFQMNEVMKSIFEAAVWSEIGPKVMSEVSSGSTVPSIGVTAAGSPTVSRSTASVAPVVPASHGEELMQNEGPSVPQSIPSGEQTEPISSMTQKEICEALAAIARLLEPFMHRVSGAPVQSALEPVAEPTAFRPASRIWNENSTLREEEAETEQLDRNSRNEMHSSGNRERRDDCNVGTVEQTTMDSETQTTATQVPFLPMSYLVQKVIKLMKKHIQKLETSNGVVRILSRILEAVDFPWELMDPSEIIRQSMLIMEDPAFCNQPEEVVMTEALRALILMDAEVRRTQSPSHSTNNDGNFENEGHFEFSSAGDVPDLGYVARTPTPVETEAYNDPSAAAPNGESSSPADDDVEPFDDQEGAVRWSSRLDQKAKNLAIASQQQNLNASEKAVVSRKRKVVEKEVTTPVANKKTTELGTKKWEDVQIKSKKDKKLFKNFCKKKREDEADQE